MIIASVGAKDVHRMGRVGNAFVIRHYQSDYRTAYRTMREAGLTPRVARTVVFRLLFAASSQWEGPEWVTYRERRVAS